MIANSIYVSPARLLEQLGISNPRDIMIEAIAEHCGATIVYDALKGSAARLIGFGNRAYITVDSESHRARQRFSAAHELGHWLVDRGKVASFVCAEGLFTTEWVSDNPERRANRFAADLLLPPFMFKPRAKNLPLTFDSVALLAREFQTSLTATAIRIVEYGSFPAMVLCNEIGRRRWFISGPDVPKEMWPREHPGAYTCAYDLLRGSTDEEIPTDVQADGWISHAQSRNYSIREHSRKIGRDLVLTMLWWEDERQLLDLDLGEDDD